MRTDELIADLAGHVTPVRPLPSPGQRAAVWLVVALASAAVGMAEFGPRSDVLVQLTRLPFVWTAALAFATSALAVFVALVLSVPGAEQTPLLRRVVVTLVAVWAVTMIWAVLDSGRGLPITSDRHWRACFLRVVVVSVIPAVVLFVMARRAAPLRPGWTAAVSAVAAASMGALVVQLACPLNDAGHSFLGHFVPVVTLGGLGVLCQRVLIARRAV